MALVIPFQLVANVLPIINLPMALGNLHIATNGFPVVPIGNKNKKLRRGIDLLSQIRHYALKQLLKTIYYSIFNLRLTYACEIWVQEQNSRLFKNLTDIIMRISLNNLNENEHPLFMKNQLLAP